MSLIIFFVFGCAISFLAFYSSSLSARDVLISSSLLFFFFFFFFVSSKNSSVVKSGGGTKSGVIYQLHLVFFQLVKDQIQIDNR